MAVLRIFLNIPVLILSNIVCNISAYDFGLMFLQLLLQFCLGHMPGSLGKLLSCYTISTGSGFFQSLTCVKAARSIFHISPFHGSSDSILLLCFNLCKFVCSLYGLTRADLTTFFWKNTVFTSGSL